MSTTKEQLINLYKEMSELTAPKCSSSGCGHYGKDRCCDKFHCELTKSWAKENWGIELKEIEHPRLLFMGEKGCTVEPHLRPLCTLHQCKISSFGFLPGQEEWNKKYFEIRNQIDILEGDFYMEKKNVS